MKTGKTGLRRCAAGFGAVALAITGLAALAPSASAAPGPDQVSDDMKGSLLIHKRVGASEGNAGTGEVIEAPAGDPLKDVKFTIWQLGKTVDDTCVAIDLRKTDQWAHVPTGTAPATLALVQEAGFCLVAPVAGTESEPTDGDGLTSFTGLDLGLYYVQETDAPATVVAKSAPFYVAVPMPLAGGEWQYAVNVYPKNLEADKPTKTIAPNPSGNSVGSNVTWTITQMVPALTAGETYRSAEIFDVLPASLQYVSSKVTLNGTELTAGTGYTLNPANNTWTLSASVLATLKANDTIVVELVTKVLSVTETGDIANPGSNGETPGYGSKFNGGTTPGGPTPHTYWGQLAVSKVDEQDRPLKDAQFKVFPAPVAGQCAAEAPADGLVSTGTSGADGVVKWTPNNPDNSSPLGLWVANSQEPQAAPSKVYCLYETKVPAGYTGVGVQTVTIKPGTANVVTLPIKNVPRDTPNLPLTGAGGTAVMMTGGLVLIGIGAVTMIAIRRRRNQVA